MALNVSVFININGGFYMKSYILYLCVSIYVSTITFVQYAFSGEQKSIFIMIPSLFCVFLSSSISILHTELLLFSISECL